MSAHTATSCPLRSMACLTVKDGIVTHVTPEWIDITGFDPVQAHINKLWTTAESSPYVSLANPFTREEITLCICSHASEKDDREIDIVCSDVTVLDSLARHNPVDHCIARLSTYGTIEAFYDQKTNWTHGIGLPLMRFVHPDDVRRLCGGLSAAELAMVSFQVRCDFYNTNYDWFDFTVVNIGNDILCIIRPSENFATKSSQIEKTIPTISNYTTLHRVHECFWKSLEAGVAAVTNSLASTLVFVVQTILSACFSDPKNGNWTLALSERMLFGALAMFKARPEIDTVWNALNWTGFFHESARCSFERRLDQGAEWLITRAYGNACIPV
ncbi:hypothetical protein J3Q64DRAFT_1763887 [Phycomyces blakesleeanus]|uniref:Uncharacterized protein n=2 Tax=Phycomyces blakesleeanus TaxID=4837 RepID=A0A163D380_PHYB8|nr:hypothetical protein PHYBLDRAFT_173382 [Phycomyces blakesleeanus NRRL 1555(-)]OAD68390.1 hypothetical protein PHYBLDRAFT_173382 [Phycomyces blakesleeanus NRRL 1555(-)]|eukprot:XP_018286430.1 hypothetical protein PHYBLDRAFT_173382 [Phycomyces blakesleeanus NRRL 1555(-)]